MTAIRLENVSTNYCLENINLNIKDSELMVLLGPSGAGKTTILNIIAGLEDYSGSVLYDSQRVDNLAARKRKVGYLFQDNNLFPHLNVYSNLIYGLKIKNTPKKVIKKKAKKIIDLLDIKDIVERYPKNLSGGEKQRAALARALITSPKILLLDEPMSSLDYRISVYLRREIKLLQQKLGITTVYVTHNFKEAEEMADRIAVINDGRLEQVADKNRIFNKPKNEKVKNFLSVNF